MLKNKFINFITVVGVTMAIAGGVISSVLYITSADTQTLAEVKNTKDILLKEIDTKITTDRIRAFELADEKYFPKTEGTMIETKVDRIEKDVTSILVLVKEHDKTSLQTEALSREALKEIKDLKKELGK